MWLFKTLGKQLLISAGGKVGSQSPWYHLSKRLSCSLILMSEYKVSGFILTHMCWVCRTNILSVKSNFLMKTFRRVNAVQLLLIRFTFSNCYSCYYLFWGGLLILFFPSVLQFCPLGNNSVGWVHHSSCFLSFPLGAQATGSQIALIDFVAFPTLDCVYVTVLIFIKRRWARGALQMKSPLLQA